MERSKLDLERETLERAYRGGGRESTQTSPLLVMITKFWQHLRFLFEKKKSVIVRQQRDRSDNVCWNAYDPVTGRSKDFNSIAALLAWIEQN